MMAFNKQFIEPCKTGFNSNKNKIQTESVAYGFEMGVCNAVPTDYVGSYKFGMDIPNKLVDRLSKVHDINPDFGQLQHTANNGARYDFTHCTDKTIHLSVKSTKKGVGKVAPQVIGQCQPKRFCDIMEIEYTTTSDLKKYIQDDIVKIIPILVGYTFDCPTIYYNDEKNTIRYITLNTPIEWNKYKFKWTRDWTSWKNSSTLKIIIKEKEYALLEFQFHTKSRTNMAIRWFYENFLTLFHKENLSIIDL